MKLITMVWVGISFLLLGCEPSGEPSSADNSIERFELARAYNKDGKPEEALPVLFPLLKDADDQIQRFDKAFPVSDLESRDVMTLIAPRILAAAFLEEVAKAYELSGDEEGRKKAAEKRSRLQAEIQNLKDQQKKKQNDEMKRLIE